MSSNDKNSKKDFVAHMHFEANVEVAMPRSNAVITGIDFAEGVITVEAPKPCQFEIDERGKHEAE